MKMREDHQEKMKELDAFKVFFVDECATNDAMVPLYGRAPKGERAVGSKPRAKGNHRTVVGALSLRCGLTATAWPGPMDGDGFLSWVEGSLVPLLSEGDVVVIDNASIHKADAVVQAIKAAGAEVLFLPPYSPDYNPIEEAWSKFKALLRRAGAHTTEALHEAIAVAARAITMLDTVGYLSHAGYLASA